jgi:hypothetical protein
MRVGTSSWTGSRASLGLYIGCKTLVTAFAKTETRTANVCVSCPRWCRRSPKSSRNCKEALGPV